MFICQQAINHYDLLFGVLLKLRLFMSNYRAHTREEIIELFRNSIVARVFIDTGVLSQRFPVCGLFSWPFTFIILNMFLKIMQIHFLLLGFKLHNQICPICLTNNLIQHFVNTTRFVQPFRVHFLYPGFIM